MGLDPNKCPGDTVTETSHRSRRQAKADSLSSAGLRSPPRWISSLLSSSGDRRPPPRWISVLQPSPAGWCSSPGCASAVSPLCSRLPGRFLHRRGSPHSLSHFPVSISYFFHWYKFYLYSTISVCFMLPDRADVLTNCLVRFGGSRSFLDRISDLSWIFINRRLGSWWSWN